MQFLIHFHRIHIEINEKTEVQKTKNQIKGIEGRTSAKYWKAINILINPETNFKTRQQKTKQDVTNAMLNYAHPLHHRYRNMNCFLR